MRILQLCNKPPMPTVDGGCKAMLQTTELLQSLGFEVHIFSISTPKHPYLENEVSIDFLTSTHLEHSFINTHITMGGLIQNFFSDVPYNVVRFYSQDAALAIQNKLEKHAFDIVIFESIYMCEYIAVVQKYSDAKIVLRSHNIEHLLWESRMKEERNYFKKLYSFMLSNKLKKYEAKCFLQFENILSISRTDEDIIQELNEKANTFNLPFLVQEVAQQSQKSTPTFYHLGAMDWQPNIDCIEYTLNELLPQITKVNDQFTFHFGGKNMSNSYKEKSSKNAIAYTDIKDAFQFISEHDVLLAPVFSGGGLRIKMIEALQHGKVIITTALGASGIPVVYNNHPCILIAENRDDFLQHIFRCLNDHTFRQQVSSNAVMMVQKEFGFSDKANALKSYLTKIEAEHRHRM